MVKQKELKRCPVVFNLADPFQKKMYDHTKQYTNFSAFMKSLVQRDMEGVPVVSKALIQKEEIIDKGLVHGLI